MKNKVETFECPVCKIIQKSEVIEINGFGNVTCSKCLKHVLLAPKNKERKKIPKSNVPLNSIS